ncbi:NCS2 family permease [Arthrobacter sp. HMSC08H08]|uniref:NCS2 family permease n=1 Tax=Arthrobacter sp. HMSC08H08 TaxID=1581143 RepID=UPI0008A651F6|nr:NCS2 family permease [Arthrobacter sp. HMSC08H08]OFT22946.1 permease [Arthrobacter sp. HMSC08H08]
MSSARTNQATSGLSTYFKLTERGSTLGREIRGGFATFFAMSYIVVLNPLILQGADTNGYELGIARVAAATAFVGGLLSIVMGLWAKQPFALATGLGVNALVAVTVATNPGLSWQAMMGLVVIAGTIMFILVLTGFRTAVFNAVPAGLKTAIVVGIGAFITLIGLVNAGFVRAGPGTVVTLGINGRLVGWPTLVFLFGLFLTIALMVRKVRGAILIGIIASAILANILQATLKIGAGGEDNPTGWALVVPGQNFTWQLPDLSLIGQANVVEAFTPSSIGAVAAILLVFVILLSIFFDAMGTMVGLATAAGTIDKDGHIENVDRVLLVDAAGAVAGGGAGVSSNQIFVESSAGIAEGARTGIAAIVTGVLFLFAMFLTPLVQFVPFEAVAPALVTVGFLMMSQVTNIDWDDIGIALPAFLTILMMPFTYSIADGIGAGFIAYVFVRLVQGRIKDIHPLMWVVAGFFLVFFGMGLVDGWTGASA